MHPSKKLIAGIVAVLAIAGGTTAFAAIPDGGGLIHGCYDKTSGQLRVYDNQSGSPKSCSTKETALNWNQQGVPGPKGDKGDTGPSDGYYYSSLHVNVDYADTVVGTLNLPAGKYLVSASTWLEALKYPTNASCTLVGGNQGDWEPAEIKPSLGVIHAGVSLSFAYQSAAAGQIQLKCSADLGDMTANSVRISAIKVGTLTTN